MNENGSESLSMNVLQGEMNRASNAINGILLSYDRLFAIGAVVFGGGLSIGTGVGKEIILVLLPMPITLLYVYGNQLLIQERAKSGYMCFLEERINELSRVNLLAWESQIGLSHNTLTHRVVLPSLYCLFLVGTWVVSLEAIWRHYTSWKSLDLVGFCASLLFVFVSSWEAQTAWKRSYHRAQAFFVGGGPANGKQTGPEANRRHVGDRV